jgi:hypothetical protein
MMLPRVGASVNVSLWNGPKSACAKTSVVEVELLVELVLVEYVTDVEVEAVVVVELDVERLVEPVTDVDWLVEAETLVDPDRLVLVD